MNEEKQYLRGCVGKDFEEIDGREFDIPDLKEFVQILLSLSKDEQVHLNYFSDEEDLDLWIGADQVNPSTQGGQN